ncbi:MAG: restriction endonuclease [Bacillaceae bacterium]|nr:MAG: restriction endonuclease [Bacillaceae bacterium]BBU38891.1 type I restriction-modification system restriction endonuclease DNA specificity subunit HsdS [Aeribacillus pallidus]
MSKKKQKSMEELLEEALVLEEEHPYKVPENWVWVRFKHLVDFFSGSAFPNQYQGYNDLEIPFYKVGNLKDTDSNYYIYSEENTISEEIRVKLKAKKVPKDTILFAKIGEAIRLNRRGLVPKPACIDNNLMGFKANENILDNKLLLYWSLKEDFYKYSQATAVPSIRKSTLEAIAFPLPPIHEQRRIAEKIERLFAKIDEAKLLIEEVKESFELQRAAILDKAFKGQLGTNDPNEKSMLETSNHIKEKDLIPKEEQPYEVPKNWVWVKTGAIFEQIKEQVLPVGNETYVGLEHLIKGGGISHTELAKDIKSKKVVFKKGDVLYGKLRPYLNKHAVVDFDGVASTDILVLRTEHKYLNQLLDYYLGLPSTIDYAVSNSNGINLPRVSPKKMNDLPFPLPPKNEWKRIVKILDKMLNNLIEEQTLIEQLEAELISLKNSILYKAFRGELGTNDLTDKHAIELLKEVLKSK